jgi:uncharacterized Zn finger protein (UPF0148 family)
MIIICPVCGTANKFENPEEAVISCCEVCGLPLIEEAEEIE